jgi:hypothetical protein
MTTSVMPDEPEPSVSPLEIEGSGFAAFPHHYYHSDGFTDLAVMRNDAEHRRSRKDKPEQSIIHLHPKRPGATVFECLGDQGRHEYYRFE